MSGAIASSVVNFSFIWACSFMRTDTSSMRFSIAWLEVMRLRGLSSHDTLGLAVRILSSSLCDCNRQLQPCASYACEVWAPASACIGPFRNLQQLQRAFLRRACRVKKSVPVDIIFQELQQMRWHDFWWRRVSCFWSALVEADTGSLHRHNLSMMRFSWPLQGANSAGLPRSCSAFSFG